MIDLAILSNGVRMPLATNDATAATFSDGAHGDEQCQVTLPRTLVEGLAVYEAPLAQVVVSEHGAPIAAYRLEQPTLSDDQLELTALGAGRALNDVVYTALLSSTDLGAWQVVQPGDAVSGGVAVPDRFSFTTDALVLRISPKKSAVYNGTGAQGRLVFRVPDQIVATRQITGVAWRYALNLPVNWTAELYRFSSAGVFLSSIWTLASTGALQTGSVNLALTGCDVLVFALYPTVNPTTYAAEDGAGYLELAEVRVVTSTANRVNTTSGGAFGPGAVTVTPASMANIYVGQRLQIGTPGVLSEHITVTAITSTTFSAVGIVGAYGAATAIRAHVVYPDEAVRDVLAQVGTLNPDQLSASTAQILTCPQDQTDLLYEDVTGDEVLNDLEARTGWRWAVRNRLLSFAPFGTNAQTWYVDAIAYTVQRDLDGLSNFVYATYQQEGGSRTLRTSAALDTASQQRFGVARVRPVTADTTMLALANATRDRALVVSASPVPQAQIAFEAIYTAQGARVPPCAVHADDTIIIRNLPPQAAQSRDAIRALRVTRREVDLLTGLPTIEAEPLDTIERLIGKTTA